MTETDDAFPLPMDIATRISELGMTGAAHTEAVKFVYALRKWTGDTDAAFRWFSERSLPSFGSRTAADLVREGRTDAARGYVERLAAGGFSLSKTTSSGYGSCLERVRSRAADCQSTRIFSKNCESGLGNAK